MKTRTNPITRKAAQKNPKWIEPLEARIAPAVTVVSVGSLAIDADGDGKADPLDQIHYNVTVQNTGPSLTGMSFQDIINDPNLTLVAGSVNVSPLAIDDAFTAVGNTLLHVGGTAGTDAEVFVTSGSLTANDFEFLGDTFLLTPIVNGASAQGGVVNVAADGTFTYLPKVNFTGTDTFTYTLHDKGIDGIDGTADDLTSTGTVTVTVANKVWYVDSSAAAGGDGRSTTPFNSLSSVSGASGLDSAGDTIFVRERAGDYDGNITLLNNQQLIGSGVNLVVGGFTLLTATSGTTVKTTAANTHAITLAQGNTVRGFSVLDTTGAGIFGSNVGAVTINSVSKTGAGKIVDLTDSTASTSNIVLDVASTTSSSSEAIKLTGINGTFTATTGAISGASGVDVFISGGNALITIGSSITSTAGGAIEVTAHTGANAISFSGALNVTGGSGINIHDNSGSSTISFTNASKVLNTGASNAVNLANNTGLTITLSGGGLDIDTTTGSGFSATGGGTINVTGSSNSINSASATALNVANTTIGASNLNFHDISAGNSSAAGDPVSGIILNNTGASGSLIVSGNGNTSLGGDFSGGLIQSTTGAGISLTSTLSPSFTNLKIINTGGSGIAGTTTTNFTFKNGTIDNSGTSLGAEMSNIAFNTQAAGTENNLSGVVTITNNILTNAYYHGIDIFNFNGTISNADISGNTITSSTSTTTSKGSGIRFIAFGSATTVANVTKATITNNIVTNFPSAAGIMVQGGNANSGGGSAHPGTLGVAGNATNIISITGNRVAGASAANRIGTQAILAVVNGYGQGNFDISSNGTVANPITNVFGTAIALSSLGFANVTATVNNNVIVANNAVGAQGIGAGTSQTFSSADTPTLAVKISNNQISATDGNGILVTARDATGTVAAKIVNNTVAAPLSGNRTGIRVDAGNSISVNDSVYLEISGNTTAGTGLTPEGIGLRKQGTSSTVNVFAIKGMSATSSPGVETYVDSQNPNSTLNGGTGFRTLLISATSGFTNWTGGAGQPAFLPLMFAPDPVDTSTTSNGDQPGSDTSTGDGTPTDTTPVDITPSGGTTTPVVVNDGSLTQAQLDALVSAAIARWEAAGLTSEQDALLHGTIFTVADLPGWYLGEASLGHITLDSNAAGNGWFIDQTPLDDAEYANIGGTLTATFNGGAKNRLDALTTVMHELGHVLGLEDSYVASDANNLMYGYLHLSERRLPVAHQADGAVPHSGTGLDFLFGPMSLGSATLPVGKSITIVYDQKVNATINANQATSQIRFTSSAGTTDGNLVTTTLDKPDVTVAVGAPSSAAENTAGTFTYTFTRQGPTTDAWTANFNVTGTASSSDYSIAAQSGVTFNSGAGTGTVTFAAGQSTATVVVTVVGDNTVELDETVTLNVTSGTNYDVGTPASASATIANDDTATISISGGSVTEGNSGTKNLPFTVTLSNPVDVDTTVLFSTADGTAIRPGDYTAQSMVAVTITAGQTTATQNVVINGDNTVELDETFTGTIFSPSAGGRSVSLGTSSATGTITNDDSATISITGGSVTEGNSGTKNLPFTITLTNPVDVDTTVHFTTADISALAGSDYVAQSDVTVTIVAGQTSVTQNVVLNGDTTVEQDETFTGTINTLSAGGRNVTLGTSSATGTITNDDSATISISAGSLSEGNSGTSNLPFTITLTNPVDVDTTVHFTTADISALAGSDYVAQSDVIVTIPAGQTSVTKNVVINGDTTVELNETFSGTINTLSAGGRNVTLGTASATATITNDDTATVSIVGGTVTEGDSGTKNLPFTISLSNPVDVDTTVQFSTEDLTATAGVDYVGQFGAVVTIPAGQTSVTKNVVINGDTTVEGDETFNASIGAPSASGRNVSVGASSFAVGTITNDDSATVSISVGSISEGNSGTTNLPFTITLSSPVDVDTTVHFTTADISALAGSDYVAQSDVIATIPKGQTSVTKNVVVNGDTTVELNETFSGTINTLSAGGRNVTLGTATATATITNDDSATVSITGGSIFEGNSGTTNLPFTITLSNPVDVDTTVQFSTADGTAIAPGDYVSQSAVSVLIPAGQTSVTKNVVINGDSSVEADETFTASIANVSAGSRSVSLGTASATGTILNDDASITLAVSPAAVAEDGATNLVYTFTRTGYLGATVTANFDVAGTATLGTDYTTSGAATFTSTAGTITFAPGDTTKSITVDPTADTTGEQDENVLLTLAAGTGYGIGTPSSADGTIQDDDTKVSVAIGASPVTENGGVGLVYTFTRTGDTALPLTVNFGVGGSGLFTNDYTQSGAATFGASAGTVLIPAGQSTATVTLTPANDTLVEGTETATLTVATGSGYGIVGSPATGSITDNDFATISLVNNTSTIGEAGGSHNIGVKLLITADGVAGTGTLAKDVTVNLQDLLTGTATGSGSDYTFASPATITFASGEAGSTKNATITLVDDTRVEGNENINLQLNSLVDNTGGQVTLTGSNSHVVTVTDNDFATISLVSNTSTIGEGAGSHNVGVALQITANGVAGTGTLERPVTVNVQDLLTGTATAGGSDYSFATPSTITFASGDASSTKNATITLVDDTRVEGNENINLQLNSLIDNTGGQVTLTGSNSHVVTVTDNDTATISLVSNTSSIGEGAGTHNIGVALQITANGVAGTGTLERPVTVNVQDLLTGTATAGGSDYSFATPSTITFASGDASSTKNATITLVDDTRVEGNENINLQLNSLIDNTGGQVTLTGSNSHVVTVTDNDTATITLGLNGSSVNENAGTKNFDVILTITANGVVGTGTLERPISVDLIDQHVGGADSTNDYTFNSPQTVTFASGAASSTQSIAVGITDDTRVEGFETLLLKLGNLVDGTSGQASLGSSINQFLNIVDNDFATISFESGTSSVGEAAGTHNVGVKLVITGNGVAGTGTLDRPLTVSVTDPQTGTAVKPGDYTLGSPQTVTFSSGEASSTKNVVIGIVDDNLSEGNETINLQLGNLNDPTESQASLGSPLTHTVTIVDNDIDLKVTKTESAPVVVAGSGAGNLTYVVTVTNNGLTDATGVVLSEDLTLVPGATVVSVTPSAGSFAVTTAPDGTWTLGNLAAGANATLTVVLTVGSSTAAGTDIIGDTATITASNEHLVNLANGTASEATSVQRLIDLQVTKTDGITSTTPGSALNYTINVTNAQPSDANGAVLTEILPAGTTFNAAGSTAGWVESSPGVYTLALGTVAGGQTLAPITFATTVKSSVQAGLESIVNTVSIDDDGTNGNDTNTGNDSATDTDTLVAAPDFVITKTATPATFLRNGLVNYSVTYSNEGNQDATGVIVTEHLPANTSFVAGGSTPGWSETSPGSGIYHFDVGALAASGSATITFQVRVNSILPPGTTHISNTASIDDGGINGADPTPTNNTVQLDSLLYQGIYVVAPGIPLPHKGAPADVRVFDVATNQEMFVIHAYESTYKDSVRVAVGDINGDGYDDIITSTRLGTGSVRVFDGATGAQFEGALSQIDPFDGKKEKGAFVASGDVTGDGHDDIIVGAARGGGTVKVYNGVNGTLVSTSTPFGTKFKGGVRVAVGDVNGDKTDDIIVGQGASGSHVTVFSGTSQTVLEQFDAAPAKYKGGVSVAAADLDGDGKADIIVGRNAGKPTQIDTFSGLTAQPIGSSILPFGDKYRFGVRVAAADVNFDGIADIIAGVGGRGNSQVKFFDGATHTEITSLAFTAFPDFLTQSLWVAGSSPVPVVPSVSMPL